MKKYKTDFNDYYLMTEMILLIININYIYFAINIIYEILQRQIANVYQKK